MNGDFSVSETFLGLYSLHLTTADGIVACITETLLCFEIPFSRIHGQYYDVCNTMAVAKNGVYSYKDAANQTKSSIYALLCPCS